MAKQNEASLILKIQCPDRVGIAAAVSQTVAEMGGWVTEASYHSDPVSNRFFMRSVIRNDSLPEQTAIFKTHFQPIADQFGMDFELIDKRCKQRVVLFVSKESHCLTDLLHRWAINELDCDLVGIVSNHDILRPISEFYGIPFHHVPIDKDDKVSSFNQIASLLNDLSPDLIVLARYMQIFPASLCDAYPSQIINIHHSFLPSFAGARPYHQAYERGVKLIGATSHYVTVDLDEGPIIEQDVIRVSHRHEINELARLGRDIERVVLARAVRNHLEHRVFESGRRTIVFE